MAAHAHRLLDAPADLGPLDKTPWLDDLLPAIRRFDEARGRLATADGLDDRDGDALAGACIAAEAELLAILRRGGYRAAWLGGRLYIDVRDIEDGADAVSVLALDADEVLRVWAPDDPGGTTPSTRL